MAKGDREPVVHGVVVDDETVTRWLGQRVPVARKQTRLSVDLDAEQHRALSVFAAQRGVRTAVVVRALLAELLVSHELADRVTEMVERE